jgi:hypothetical protein
MGDHKAMLDRFNQRIEEMEGKIALTKDKVDVLRDTVLVGSAARTKVIIAHKNEMGTSFVLEKVTYTLDGEELYSRDDPEGGLNAQKEFEVFNGGLTPGSHELSVAMTYSGSSFGVFTYLKGYKFNVNSKWRFSATDGRQTRINVVSFAKGDITTTTSDRIAVRYDTEVTPIGQNGEVLPNAPTTPPTDQPAAPGTPAPAPTAQPPKASGQP